MQIVRPTGPNSLFVTCATELVIRDHYGRISLAQPGVTIAGNKSISTEDFELVRFSVVTNKYVPSKFPAASFQKDPVGMTCFLGLDYPNVPHKLPNYYPLEFPYVRLRDDGFHGPVTGPLLSNGILREIGK